ncbi:mannose-6-phosphate isomerase, partial [Francisella tularensis subsp. holarctica]|nr:mannose-6-phosphate isomerase [Francisella tularensis subsp. holarctica]
RTSITVDDFVREYNVGELIFIPKEAVHRLENFTDSDIQIIEVQFGDYLGEDDIVRLEDIYKSS